MIDTSPNDVAEQNIITIEDGELKFFDEFTKKYGILWTYEERNHNILPLSKSYVGYITTPLRVLTLKPKYKEIGFKHIMRMYLYVHGYRPNDNAAVLDVSSADTSADVAELFLKNLRRNVQEGIIRTYERRHVQKDCFSGRVNYTRTYVGIQKKKRKFVSARVSALTVNNVYNSLILTALKKLQHVKKYSSEATALSMYFEGAKSNVTNGSQILETIHFNSNTSRYRRTLTYSAMIIDQLSYSDKGTTVGTDSFLVNFDRLFEDFVAKILKEIPEKKEFSTWATKRKFAEVTDSIGHSEERVYQPDVLYKFIEEDERYDYLPSAYAVLDVKNKAYGQFKNADIYQILAYTRQLHAEKALLLYPSFQQKRPEQLNLEPSIFSPSVVSACFVNIADATGEEFLSSIRWFVDSVVKTISDIPI